MSFAHHILSPKRKLTRDSFFSGTLTIRALPETLLCFPEAWTSRALPELRVEALNHNLHCGSVASLELVHCHSERTVTYSTLVIVTADSADSPEMFLA